MSSNLGEWRPENSGSNRLMEFIVALSILQMILAATIPSIKVFQVPVELLLAVLLVFKICTIKLLYEHVFLITILVFATLWSFFTLDLNTFLVNTKQNSLGVMSLICFSRIKFYSKFIFPVVVITSLMIIINRMLPQLMLPYISLTFDVAYNQSTFGGLFLNSHFNAFFLAIALIYYGRQRFLFGGGFLLVYLAASKFILVSYIANLFCTLLFRAYGISRKRFFIWGTLAGFTAVVLAGIYWSEELTEVMILWNTDIGETQNSLVVIVLQLIDPVYYTILLNLFPSGTITVSEAAKLLYLNHDGHIELGFLMLAGQSGVLLGFVYLLLLLKNSPLYVVFILVSLMHNNFIMSPLCVYMLVTYSSFNVSQKFFRVKTSSLGRAAEPL